MLFGPGVSPRKESTPLGVLAPDLAAYRAAVTPTTQIPMSRPNAWHLAATVPYHLSQSASLSPEARAMRGAAVLQGDPAASTFAAEKHYQKVRARPCAHARRAAKSRPLARPPLLPAPCACPHGSDSRSIVAPRATRPQHLLIEAPDMRICASRRRIQPRSRLDARMYAPSPG